MTQSACGTSGDARGLLSLAGEVHALLVDRGETVGCAESLTGGELAALLSATPGASASFAGAVVCYASEVKRSVLGVTADRVVSAAAAQQLASGARALLGVDWALATTGVAGPEAQEGQPVGTVHLGVAGPGGVRSTLLALSGTRVEIRAETCRQALLLLWQEVRGG